MGAARMMFSLGVVGVAAGAYLAFATVPSFAPYRDRRATAPVVLSQPIQGDRQTADLSAPSQERGDGLRLRPDFEQGTLVVELPRWAQETGSWYAFGRRALQDWNGWIDPQDDRERSWNDRRPRRAQRQDSYDQGYAAPQAWDDSYGYRSHDDEERYAPDRQPEPEPVPESGANWAERGSDAAGRSADRAREVARDVQDALKDL